MTGPATEQPYQCDSAARGSATVPRAGFNPTTPQLAAGTRSEPPPSVPSASGTIPLATAAAPPPVDPPALRDGSSGFRVPPVAVDSVSAQIASSGIRVLPTTTAPAARSRRTSSSSAAAGSVEVAAEPCRVGSPATSMLSLIATGTPASGSEVRSVRADRAAASARAASVATTWKAPSRGSSASIRASDVSTTSCGLRRPAWTSAAIATAVSVFMRSRFAGRLGAPHRAIARSC